MFGTAAGSKRRDGDLPARWMRVAAGKIGTLEDVRKRNGEAEVQRYLARTGFSGIEGEPWCSTFVRWVMEQIGYAPCRGVDTRAWLGWGERTPARYGAVAVFEDSDVDSPGHVGFYVGESRNCVYVLGGNTWARGRYAPGIGIRAYSKARLVGYRWPADALGARARSVVSAIRFTGPLRLPSRSSLAARKGLAFGGRRSGLRDQLAQLSQTTPQSLLGVFRQLV